jgi:hypothetical protein
MVWVVGPSGLNSFDGKAQTGKEVGPSGLYNFGGKVQTGKEAGHNLAGDLRIL